MSSIIGYTLPFGFCLCVLNLTNSKLKILGSLPLYIPTNENPTDPPITYKPPPRPTPDPTKNFSTAMAYTANWGQFWNGGSTYVQNGNPIKNWPATYENFIGAGQVDIWSINVWY